MTDWLIEHIDTMITVGVTVILATIGSFFGFVIAKMFSQEGRLSTSETKMNHSVQPRLVEHSQRIDKCESRMNNMTLQIKTIESQMCNLLRITNNIESRMVDTKQVSDLSTQLNNITPLLEEFSYNFHRIITQPESNIPNTKANHIPDLHKTTSDFPIVEILPKKRSQSTQKPIRTRRKDRQ